MFSRQTPPQTHPATGAHAQPSQGISVVHNMRTTFPPLPPQKNEKRKKAFSIPWGGRGKQMGLSYFWIFFSRLPPTVFAVLKSLTQGGERGGAQKRKWTFSSLSPISKALCAPQVTPRKRPQRNLLTQGTGKRVERGGIRQCYKISKFLFAFSFSGKVHVW